MNIKGAGSAGGGKGGKKAAKVAKKVGKAAGKGGKGGKTDEVSGAPIVISAGIVVKGGREIIRDLDWLSETEFTSVGVKHCTFWTLNG